MPRSLLYGRFRPLLTNISSRKSQGLYRCFMFVSILCLTFRPASPAINSLNTASNSSLSQTGLANNRTSASLCQPGCLNQGTCDMNILTKEASCTCPPPDLETFIYFRGSSCQTEAVRCNETFWCENGGVCQAGLGSGEFTCSCTGAFQGSKCQTPVVVCDAVLWCANGGICDRSAVANRTICMCPSTHTGLNCETLIEPQEFAPPQVSAMGGLDSSPDGLSEEEKAKYLNVLFGVMGGLLLVWAGALFVVHYPNFQKGGEVKLGKMRPLQISDRELVEEAMCHTPGAQPRPGECSMGVEVVVEGIPRGDLELISLEGTRIGG